MSYAKAIKAAKAHRDGKISSLLGERAQTWFLSAWDSLSLMLKDMGSDDENKEVSELYVGGTAEKRMQAHAKLDYVCGLRREIRKQYVSGVDGIYTDVTPFRHGVLSAHGANLFDNALDQIVTRKGDQ